MGVPLRDHIGHLSGIADPQTDKPRGARQNANGTNEDKSQVRQVRRVAWGPRPERGMEYDQAQGGVRKEKENDRSS